MTTCQPNGSSPVFSVRNRNKPREVSCGFLRLPFRKKKIFSDEFDEKNKLLVLVFTH